jgi:hypothetical protein
MIKNLLFALAVLCLSSPAFSEGRQYKNKKEPHCTLWDTMRLKWPQTVMGREKIKCRRRAELHNVGPVTCRYVSWKWNEDDPTQRLCTYVKAGSNIDPPTTTIVIEGGEPCPKQFKCARNK